MENTNGCNNNNNSNNNNNNNNNLTDNLIETRKEI